MLCLTLLQSLSLSDTHICTHTCMLIFTLSVSAWCEKREEWQQLIRAGTTSLLYFLLSVFSCSSALASVTSSSNAFISSLCASLCLSSDPNAVGQHGTDHALIGGVVAVVVFVTLCLIIVLGRYLARHKGKTTVDWIWVSQGLQN